jgi:hypothetical protein
LDAAPVAGGRPAFEVMPDSSGVPVAAALLHEARA